MSGTNRAIALVLVVAITCLAALVFAGAAGWVVAGCGALALFSLAYFSATRRRESGGSAPTVQAITPASLVAPAVLRSLDDPIIVLDGTGRIVSANAASEAVIGAGTERKHISGVLRMPELLAAVERVLAAGGQENIEFNFLVPVERHFRAHVAAVPQESPGANHLLIQLHDLTAVRRAEQMRVDFVANASHELRTPLAAVGGFIETLRGHAKNDEKAREKFLDIMSVETGRMQRLIADLLSLSRIELNEHVPPSDVTDVAAVVRDAVAVLVPLADADRINFEVAAHDPLLAVGDRDELIQVFQNLIHNAIKYGREGGTVRIDFGRATGENRREAAGLVSVRITDEGDGIPREAIPRLTERFYRVDAKRSRERGGTGLGLAIVKHILNRHHGRLIVDSVQGAGSTFTVLLPAAVPAQPASP